MNFVDLGLKFASVGTQPPTIPAQIPIFPLSPLEIRRNCRPIAPSLPILMSRRRKTPGRRLLPSSPSPILSSPCSAMEDENVEISGKTLPSNTDKKHAAMIERLSNLHQARLQQSRKSDSDSSTCFESTESFVNRFVDSKRLIEASLDRCRSASDPASRSRLKSDLESISLAIADLEKFVSENSYFLPSYEVRSSLKTISDLKTAVEIANSELLPRKKFSFRNKPPKKEPDNRVTDPIPAILSDSTAPAPITVRDSPGFKNEENTVLEKDFRVLDGGDFTLSDLNSCVVYLRGCLRSLFVHRMKNCRVYVGPVFGSILIEEVEDCLFMLASHQIRIHHARNTDFYLRVRSRPIIEDSCKVRFAPYHLFYDGIEKDLKSSRLEEETRNWENVDDFKWLRAVQSPNWCVLPEEERACEVNITNLGILGEDNSSA